MANESKKKSKNLFGSLFKKVANSMRMSNKKDKSIIAKKKIQDINVSKIKKVLVSKNVKVIKNPKIKKEKKILPKVKKTLKGKKRVEKKVETVKAEKPIKLKKVSHNPIISPSLYSWESKATFNPTAFVSEDKVHIIYRAMGEDDSSVLGYASSSDGLTIDERPTYCIYKRLNNYVKEGLPLNYSSGGGWNGGCEDPRITLINDTLYMIYTAFDGWGSLRMALTSILLSDFKNKKWNWKKEVLISPPGEMNKNWVLFPEKINGKFAIMHSFYPNILINYFDSLDELDGKKFIKSNNTRPIDKDRTWDSWFRGIGPTPIKTAEGWLVLYHAMDHRNPDRYRMGALILDLNDPTKVLYRSKNPILEPEETYENNGHKWGVIYSCGAVLKLLQSGKNNSSKKEELYVYYGGADKFVCVASIPLSKLIDSLKEDKIIKLKNIKNRKEI